MALPSITLAVSQKDSREEPPSEAVVVLFMPAKVTFVIGSTSVVKVGLQYVGKVDV